jgi:hypothetical protein
MSIDMYGEKVASASALIREFAHTEYYHYFAINMEASLEAFIAMMDSCREEGRQESAARIAELEAQVAELRGNVPQWISINESLPQDYMRVMVLKDCGLNTLPSHAVAYLENSVWIADMGAGSLRGWGYQVTHWMPLPAAPSTVEG